VPETGNAGGEEGAWPRVLAGGTDVVLPLDGPAAGADPGLEAGTCLFPGKPRDHAFPPPRDSSLPEANL